MFQIFLFSALLITALGDRLDNRYLPPGPVNDNNNYQPPPIDASFKNPIQPFTSASQPQQQYTPSNFQQPSQNFQKSQFPTQNFQQPKTQFLTPKTQESEQSSQPSNQFGQFSQHKQSNNGANQPSNQFGQFSQNKQSNTGANQPSNQFGQFSQHKQSNTGVNQPSNQFSQSQQFNNPSRQYLTPNKQESQQTSNQFGQFSQPKQSNNGFSQNNNGFSQNKQFNNNKDASEASSNSFGQYQNSNQGQYQNSNQGQYQNSNQGQFPSFQSNQAQIGLVKYEINPDGGDGHYNFLYETENGIRAQEEGFVQNQGKSAQGGYSYTSPEGEQVSIEYTADENGFVPKGSHVPQIPDAILKSIELNKAAEARGEYNEGSYKEGDDTGHGFQQQNNGYQYSGNQKRFPEQASFASQENKQVSPFGAQQNVKSSFGSSFPQQNNQATPFGSSQVTKSFGQQKNGYPSDQGSFASQDNKQVVPSAFNQKSGQFGGSNSFQTPSKSFQQGQGYQYSKPNQSGNFQRREQESAPSGVQSQYSAPKFGTVQDQSGYKY